MSRLWTYNYDDRGVDGGAAFVRLPAPDVVGFRMQRASLSQSDTGRSDNNQSAVEPHFEQFVQPFAHKWNDCASSRSVRSKQDYSRMLMNRVALEISDALVKCEQDPISGKGGIHNGRVCRAAKSFVGDPVGIVAEAAKIRHQFHREVFVKLELHIARIGTRRSSCANSAA
jgi:hypothetical protein